MSELFEIAERERDLYAVLQATEAKRDQAAIALGKAIDLHSYNGRRSKQENEARKALLEAIKEKNTASSMWAQAYKALKALKAATVPEAA
jgi:chorismate-pyruvate lyase